MLLALRSPRTPDSNGMVRQFYVTSCRCMRGLRRMRNMEVHTIDMELGKPVFHLVDAHAR